MKKRYFKVKVALFLAVIMPTGMYAQENIKAAIKKCEKMEVIEADIVRYKEPGLKGLSRTTVLIKMMTSPELEKMLEEAFHQDSEKATQAVEQKKEGRISHMYYKFDYANYSYTISNDTVNIQANERTPLIRIR
jgi:hypothetical protein